MRDFYLFIYLFSLECKEIRKNIQGRVCIYILDFLSLEVKAVHLFALVEPILCLHLISWLFEKSTNTKLEKKNNANNLDFFGIKISYFLPQNTL